MSLPGRVLQFGDALARGRLKGEVDMATAHHVLAIARDEIGTTESPPDSNVVKYSRWYPMNGSPWCAMFVSWVLDQAGITGYKHAYTPTGAERFRQPRVLLRIRLPRLAASRAMEMI
jgi:hypothetical protein